MLNKKGQGIWMKITGRSDIYIPDLLRIIPRSKIHCIITFVSAKTENTSISAHFNYLNHKSNRQAKKGNRSCHSGIVVGIFGSKARK